MKLFTLALIILILNIYPLESEIVINEVLYDPSGSDGGYEWIELYNASDEIVELSGWEIQKAGSEFVTLLSLPDISIEPAAHLLIGDEFVENADLIAELSFQNGGSATDGIRIVAPDGLYTDTVLYDEPNENLLPDDASDPGQFFAPDVSGGHSLARISDGVDSNNCQIDWFDCENPSPGAANFFPIDLEISYLNIAENGANYEAFIGVKNLSTVDVDNYSASLEITINNSFLGDFDLPEIVGEDSVEIIFELGSFEQGYYVTSITLNYLYDNELDNNFLSSSFLNGVSPIVFNEVMFKPEESSYEWIELYNISSCGYVVDNFSISDAGEGKILFSGYIEAEDYIVVCENLDQLLFQYPDLQEEKAVQSESWTSLNNTVETLILSDQFETDFELIDYQGSNCPENISLERINPFLGSEPDNWGFSLNSATPGSRNSIYVVNIPPKAKLNINPNPFSPSGGERAIISYKLPEKLSMVTVRIFDLKGRLEIKLIDQEIKAAEGEFIWNGRDKGNRLLPIGIYLILMEATSLATEKVYKHTDTIVIGK